MVEVKMPHWKTSIDRAFVDDVCDELALNENESGTIQFHLKTPNRCYNPGFIQLPTRCLDDFKIVTLVSKWLGEGEERWFSAFQRCRDLGYSMIHFTPLQARGHSNSPYSIKDQLTLSDDLFSDPNLTREARKEQFSALLSVMKQKFNLSGMIDMVWNHTACDSPWLLEHPEAAYNLQNSPHLKPAFALDELILMYSAELEDHGRGHVQGESDLLALMDEFKNTALPKIKLWEFFVIDVAANERALEDAIKTGIRVEATSAPVDLENAVEADGEHGRFSYSMNLKLVCKHFSSQIESYNLAPIGVKDSILSEILAQYRQALDALNLPKYQKYDDIITRACQNIFHRVQYERLAENGPKLGPISGT
jgi:glycogen debranching enzyme